jgi:TetR/AcrR family transcriptional regulator, tetracycline repressor protein
VTPPPAARHVPAALPAPARGRGRPRRLERDDVLDAAEHLLGTAGVAGVGMRSVADALGCAPMTLYSSFPSKRHLLDALAERLLGRHDPLPDPTLPLPERVADWMERFRRAALEGRLYELFSEGPPLAWMVATAGEWIRQLLDDGCDEPRATVVAQHLLWTVNGFCLTQASAGRPIPAAVLDRIPPDARDGAQRYLAHQPRTDPDELFALLVQAVVAGLG